jgi:alpha-tubulin suppressor-like RCC1 family protein
MITNQMLCPQVQNQSKNTQWEFTFGVQYFLNQCTHNPGRGGDGQVDLIFFTFNVFFQLGLGHTHDVYLPQSVETMSGKSVTSLACGGKHSLLIAGITVTITLYK